MALYLIPNHAMQTTAAPAGVTTGTAIKTLLQFKAGATTNAKLKMWGISFDGFAAAAPGKIECIETGTVAATVTASATADITRYGPDALSQGDPVTALIAVGTTSTGYTATAEGTVAAVRNLSPPLFLAPTTQPYIYEFSLGQEPLIQMGNIARIRVTFGTAVNALCFMIVEV